MSFFCIAYDVEGRLYKVFSKSTDDFLNNLMYKWTEKIQEAHLSLG